MFSVEQVQRGHKEHLNILDYVQAQTAKTAREIWDAAVPANSRHPYLVRKGIPNSPSMRVIGARGLNKILPENKWFLSGEILVIPIKKVGGGLSTVELITECGKAFFLPGKGTLKCGYWATNRLPEDADERFVLLIGESVAVAVSASISTGHTAVATMGNINLPLVAEKLRDKYQSAKIVILASVYPKTGIDSYAASTAEAVGGVLAVPDAKNFNEMLLKKGRNAVASTIEDALRQQNKYKMRALC